MIYIEQATPDTVDYIARHMRSADRLELAATWFDDDPGAYLAQSISGSANLMAFVAIDEDAGPVSVWGVMQMWPGVGTAYAFGTPFWGRAMLPMTKHVIGFMIPTLLENGYHRIECKALASRDDVRRWLALFGLRPETVMRSFGKSGEDFVLYRWLAHEHRPAAAGSSTAGEHQAGVGSRHSGAGRSVRDLLQ